MKGLSKDEYYYEESDYGEEGRLDEDTLEGGGAGHELESWHVPE